MTAVNIAMGLKPIAMVKIPLVNLDGYFQQIFKRKFPERQLSKNVILN